MSETTERPALMTRPIPAPAVTLESKPFFDAAAEGKFLIKRCTCLLYTSPSPRDS